MLFKYYVVLCRKLYTAQTTGNITEQVWRKYNIACALCNMMYSSANNIYLTYMRYFPRNSCFAIEYTPRVSTVGRPFDGARCSITRFKHATIKGALFKRSLL